MIEDVDIQKLAGLHDRLCHRYIWTRCRITRRMVVGNDDGRSIAPSLQA